MSDPAPRPVDYGALNALHAALLGGVAVAAHRRGGRPVRAGEWAQLGMATFAISKAVTREKIGRWIREPLTEEDRSLDGHQRAEHVRRTLGELVTCPRCVGTWTSLGLLGLRVASPDAARVVTGVFATAGANDFLQAAFRLLCNRSNVVQHEAERTAGD